MSTRVEIDSKLAKDISEIAKSENISEDKALNEALEIGVKTMKKEALFKELEKKGAKIANKDTYNPDPKKNREMAGFIKGVKPFNAVKLIREMREGGHDIP